MSEFIKREAVMKAFADFVWNSNHSDLVPAPTWNQAVDIVMDFPAADVVEVVRCRDCIHNYANMVPGGEGCAKCTELPIAPDFFCKSGERKGGDE